jgi:hypothetical protein
MVARQDEDGTYQGRWRSDAPKRADCREYCRAEDATARNISAHALKERHPHTVDNGMRSRTTYAQIR